MYSDLVVSTQQQLQGSNACPQPWLRCLAAAYADLDGCWHAAKVVCICQADVTAPKGKQACNKSKAIQPGQTYVMATCPV